jgi:hypothetical protein
MGWWRTNTLAGVSLTTSGAVNVNAGIVTTSGGTVTIDNGGALTIAAAGDITADGAVTQIGGGAVFTAGDVSTTDDVVSFASAVTLTGPVAISTVSVGGGNDITFSSTLDGGANLNLTAGAGDILWNDAVGSGTPLGRSPSSVPMM